LSPLRILIITHSSLSAEFGAGQVATNLGEALKDIGHDVTLWSPQPLPLKTKWWQSLQEMRSKVNAFLNSQEAFDVIDCPATLITRRMCQSAIVVARSTQPELLYLALDFGMPTRWSFDQLLRLPFHYLHTLFHIFLVLQGWQKANFILCLGRLESDWMNKWFPFWRNKIRLYVNAPSKSDQSALAEVRNQRHARLPNRRHFLWIGRWTEHKGTNVLVDFISEWSKQQPQDVFTIAGCGSNAEKDCPQVLLQKGTLKIIPSFKREELIPLLAAHDIGLFTSKVEGWGLSLNEMLESGMPVFATPAGAVADLQPFFRTLRLFPPAISFLSTLQQIEMREDYYQTFNWQHIAQEYLQSIIPKFAGNVKEGCYQ
jgi:glycosyltransferase involved in cell wall biosynthesis